MTARKLARRWLQAGLLEAPPAMLAAITEWAQAQVAANTVATLQAKADGYREWGASRAPVYAASIRAIKELAKQAPTGTSTVLRTLYKGIQKDLPPTNYHETLETRDFQGLTPEKRIAIQEHLQRLLDAIDRFLDGGAREALEVEKKIDEYRKFLRPGVSPLKPNETQVTKVFPVDVRGWRYAKLVDLFPARHQQMLEEVVNKTKGNPAAADIAQMFQSQLDALIQRGEHPWSKIKVTLGIDVAGTQAKANWVEMRKTININVFPEMQIYMIVGPMVESIRHELQHFAQSYMHEGLRMSLLDEKRKPGPGLPSRHIMTPQYRQRETAPRGMSETWVHALDDVEFYTRLSDSIALFERQFKGLNYQNQQYHEVDLTDEEKKKLLMIFVGLSRPIPGKMDIDLFFHALRTHAQGKWKKAVKEAVKRLL